MSGTDSPSSATPPEPTPPRRRPWWRDLVLITVTAAVVLLVQALIGDDGDDLDEDRGGETSEDEADARTTDPPDTTSSTEPTEPSDNFEDGLWLVGTDIRPGRYIARPQGAETCGWARLDDVADESVIVAQSGLTNQVVVDVMDTDAGFRSNGCGVWEIYEPRSAAPSTSIEEGDWVVGEQVEPGVYQSTSASSCRWERASGFAHTAQEVIDSLPAEPRPETVLTVTLVPGERFTTANCATWVRVG